jgi:hypothetical protein
VLVAEKVMGFVRRELGPDDPLGRWQSPDGLWFAPYCPAYSTDITAAWKVLKKLSMKRLGPEYHPDSKIYPHSRCRSGLYKPVIQLELYEHDNEYHVTIGRCKGIGSDDDIVVMEVGGTFDTTIPLLICRAALLCVEKP